MLDDDVFADLDKGDGADGQTDPQKPATPPDGDAAGESGKGGLSKAVKAEEKKVAELERLRELRDKKKKLAKELQDGGGDDAEKPAQPDISTAVGEELKKRDAAEYESRMVAEIKALAKSNNLTKADAEEILRTANAIPKSGNAALDVDFAVKRVMSLRGESSRRGGVPGSFSASSPFDAMDSGSGDSGMSEAQKAVNREVGVSDEDYANFKDGFTPHAKKLFTNKETGVSRFLDRSDMPANAI